ncbi:uncharacterized protein LOC126851415 [Cataglyphis hispanica]|uniref:uncharacterized protein LOC126851415 n=1 Tax=Cataglyphis hispanica TaxID=1086592 RepID=UPI0021802FDB|nr:uncharacterized protein LOC126851415 [Cataglyphis hispanica]
MKTLVLVTCLLTISYAADPEVLKKVYEHYNSCLEELNEQQWTPEVVNCYLYKAEMIDEQGKLKKEKILAFLDKITSDENNLRHAKEIISTCFDQANQGPGNDNQKLKNFIECGIPVSNLIDKPQ